MKKKIFIAATRQNDGKTTVSLGLFDALRKRDPSIQYMKPVGQQTLEVNGSRIDKDAVLFQQTFGLNEESLPLMSPVASPKGFTETYISQPDPTRIDQKIQLANDKLGQTCATILYEGTGHAGVGSVFDHSNAHVAKRLNAPVILVSIGGIGKSIDEIMLNAAVFKALDVPIMGVIINKVIPQKYDKINRIVRNGLKRLDIDVLGVLPLNDQLTHPTISAIVDELKPNILYMPPNGKNNIIEKFLIGDMMPHNALDHFSENTLMIVPGNREGLVLTALCENLLTKGPHLVSGIVFTNGIRPHQKILDLLYTSQIPLFMVEEDAFLIATKINHMIVKIRSEDKNKIDIARSLIDTYVDVDAIYNRMGDA
jgi:BioD-like phosphotransacetylase family protein